MAVDTSRIMIKTFVKSVLKDAEEAPERCTRNLVDMALNFAEEGSQKSFLKLQEICSIMKTVHITLLLKIF